MRIKNDLKNSDEEEKDQKGSWEPHHTFTGNNKTFSLLYFDQS